MNSTMYFCVKKKVSKETKSLLMEIGEAASKLDENKVEKVRDV